MTGGPRPELSPSGRRRVAEIVAALHAAGVFAPAAPDPAHLAEAVADYGEPVTVDSVLAALHEADLYHPDFRAAACTANLVFHNSHTEQHDDALCHQIDELAVLTALEVSVRELRLAFAADGEPADRAVLDLAVNGAPLSLDYAAAPKYLSTVLHVALARALRTTGAARRLAWYWTDQGVWITTLSGPGVERLNRALDLGPDRWEWVDEQAAVAAGG